MERKTISDVYSSLFDSRLYEQQARLKQSKIKNVVYLIEGELPAFGGGGRHGVGGDSKSASLSGHRLTNAAIAPLRTGSAFRGGMFRGKGGHFIRGRGGKAYYADRANSSASVSDPLNSMQSSSSSSPYASATLLPASLFSVLLRHGFVVHHCRHNDESVAFLAALTREMAQGMLHNLNLYSHNQMHHIVNTNNNLTSNQTQSPLDINNNNMSSQNHPTPDIPSLKSVLFSASTSGNCISFDSFQLENKKNRTRVLRTCWAAQLSMLPHIGSRSAQAIARVFPTPHALWKV